MDAHTSPWSGRPVLVTGCTGFLGSAVTRELIVRGATIVGLVRDPGRAAEFRGDRFRMVRGRAEDAIRLHSTMAVHEVSAVFHLAPSDPTALLRAAALHHPRMPVVTARPAGQLRLATTDFAPPAVPFGIARFGELFGPGDRQSTRVVPRTASGLASGEQPTIPTGPARDFVFVRDAARACLALAEAVASGCRPLDQTFRSGWDLTEAQMARHVSDVFAGLNPATPEPPAKLLEWTPATSLADALADAIDWHLEAVRSRIIGHAPTGRKAA